MTATDTYLLLRAFCDELARCGLEHACTSPGSRNTPLILSLVRQPGIRCWSHIDERCAGFFAVGAAKAAGRPVAVTCTSGSAVANLHPAVVEAHYARVPLLVLTADRPPELREVGAGQAIDQLKLYGDAVKWFFEVGVHEATPERLRWIRALACRAYWTALEGRSGPVHLNFPLREPLILDDPLDQDPVPGRPGGRPWVGRPAASPRLPDDVVAKLGLGSRGVIVAGRRERSDGMAGALERFAARSGYPVLADPTSGARSGPAAIAHYDLLLRDAVLAGELAPEVVIRVGDLPTSKPLRAWLAGLGDARQIAIDPENAWQDPDARVDLRLGSDPTATLDALDGPAADERWLSTWRNADQRVAERLAEGLGPALSEPLVAARLGQWLAPEACLVVGSSMPIRDVELYFPARVPLPRVLANRGANGIDGTVSTAFGIAAAAPGPVVLLIGDVAVLHDLGGLLAARRLGLDLTIIVLNNDGGGIFEFLPVASQGDAFEDHVATPHGIGFREVAGLFGCGYSAPTDEAGLHEALDAAHAGAQTTIIEVRTDRRENLELHRRLAESGLGALRTR
jgi:2-succinyl-5-enolpyruvyl-6-hydroxy-3-cyclohexene-1-carboxylate synthase